MSTKLLFSMLSRFLSAAQTPLLSGALLLLACGSSAVFAQTPFNSGSTGADGALNDTTLPAACTRATNTITCTLPASTPGGVFNFTTVTIPAGVTLQFIKNARNTPVTMLATGDVTINGMINIKGTRAVGIAGAEGGPGGFRGGDGGVGIEADLVAGKSGEGPGGGSAGKSNNIFGGGAGFAIVGATSANGNAQNGGLGGPRYGSRTLLPLIGGSGGGGTAASTSSPGNGGGGGGGAILIASSGRILFGSTSSGIDATGGNSAFTAGGGSGGQSGWLPIPFPVHPRSRLLAVETNREVMARLPMATFGSKLSITMSFCLRRLTPILVFPKISTRSQCRMRHN